MNDQLKRLDAALDRAISAAADCQLRLHAAQRAANVPVSARRLFTPADMVAVETRVRGEMIALFQEVGDIVARPEAYPNLRRFSHRAKREK